VHGGPSLSILGGATISLCRYVIAKNVVEIVLFASRARGANAMSDEKSIVETITEDIAEAAKAVVAEVKSIAAEVTDAVESAVACDEEAAPPKDDASPADGSKAPR
jgi:hypothetical protein